MTKPHDPRPAAVFIPNGTVRYFIVSTVNQLGWIFHQTNLVNHNGFVKIVYFEELIQFYCFLLFVPEMCE